MRESLFSIEITLFVLIHSHYSFMIEHYPNYISPSSSMHIVVPGNGISGLWARTLSNHFAQLLNDISLVTSYTTITTDGWSHWKHKQNFLIQSKISQLKNYNTHTHIYIHMYIYIELNSDLQPFILEWLNPR